MNKVSVLIGILLAHMFAQVAHAEGTVQPCELHVWGARKSFPETSKFAAPFAIRGTFHADRSQPLANINVLDPVLRLSRISDRNFDGLFGTGVAVNVVRHSDPIDPNIAGSTKAPLSPSSAPCRGDIILSDLVDIEGPTRNVGILAGLMMAPAGMNMKITFRRFDGQGRLIFAKRDGVNGDLAVPRSKWSDDQDAAIKAIDDSVANGVQKFTGKLASK